MEKKLDILLNKDGKTYIEIKDLEAFVKKNDEEYDNLQKHCNGYAYDSLVYRYQFVRMKLAQYDAEEYLMMNGGSRVEARARANNLAQRDIMRFGQILDEVMKEHD